ncbi:hypothetical protein OOZ19_20105 [Saccharopolyspora sp. NFXS83]|uniref:hypothetical protein n=1 Tax=Saccharopolyspora sp. NFXS83 TaxID=2993560 RepID=UPI00224A78FB|nr:hypothetical protein [Saccharopolyspora sp. NFXS83]MCX2732548.1 hypothetical protein [Saccharopolyspora sp. NFXS83]
MTAALIRVTSAELHARRAQLLALVPFSEDELVQRAAEDHTASPDEREIYNELVEIDFLLGNVRADERPSEGDGLR